MKLTNDQIYALGNAGFGRLNYANLEAQDALQAYRLRKHVMACYAELENTKQEIINDIWPDKEMLARAAQYERTGEGMTEAEYKEAIGTSGTKAAEMFRSLGAESRDIDVHPIAFASWLQLLKDNPYLAGFEETLAEFIAE